jgi:hypothetical protein
MGDRVDTDRRGLIRFGFPVTNGLSFRLGAPTSNPAAVSAFWWYWSCPEEASALA